ncbi:MAG: rhodanese-like domain-containing protein [Anaerolineales bacterium]|nr:rhodanese-like domain-containing protein [Anaerolineales bacterium]
MTKNKFILISFSTLLLATLACNSTLPQTGPTQSVISTLELPQGQDDSIPQSEGAVPRVTVEEAKAALDSGEAIIVDVRGPDAFANSHIPGAISIPLGEFESNIANVPLDKDQWIITYCT